MPLRYDAIMFDFDGVLVESADIKTEAFSALYAEHGPDILAQVLAHHGAHEGISRVEKIKFCHWEYLGIDLDADALAAEERRYSDLVKGSVVACDAVPGSLEFLKARRGRLKMFVISGTPELELRDIVAARGMSKFFDAVYGSPRLKEPIVEDILETHGIDARRALFVGDAMTDWRAADATGLDFLGRVGVNDENPFPDGTTLIQDLTELAGHL